MRLLAAIALGAIAAAIYFFTPAKDYLSTSGIVSLKQTIAASGPLAPLVFIALYVGISIFCLPGSPLSLAAGALFGEWLGLLYVVIGSNLGAHLGFFLARGLGHDFATRLLRGRFERLEVSLEKNAFLAVLGTRLIPGLPFAAVNYACGLAPIPWRDYALATLVGMLPTSFAFVSLGNVVNAVEGVSFTDPEILRRPEVWGPFLLVIVLASAPRLYQHFAKRPPPPAPPKSL